MIGQWIDHLWQSTIFAAGAAVLTLAFRGNRAGVRYWLWLSASLKFLIPFALLIGLGAQFQWAPARRAAQIAPPTVTYTVVQLSQPFSGAPRPAPPKDWRPAALAGVWACGFGAVALMRFRAWRRVRAAVRTSARLEIPAAVEIRSSPGRLEPGIVGVFRPVLLLPEGIAERLTPDQLETVLAHELCHARRRDNLTAVLHMAVEALFWFHPMVWWIGARLVEERERACDEGVMRLGREPRVYADAILNVCRMYVESPLACVAGVTGADLRKRVEAIMTNRIGRRLNSAKRLLLAGAAAMAVAAPVVIGLFIGAGNAPLIRAQVLGRAISAGTNEPAGPQAQDQDERHFVMVFDFGGEHPENARDIASASDFVRNKMTAADHVAVMRFGRGGATLVLGFTQDKAAVGAAIRQASAVSGPKPEGYIADVAHIEPARRLLQPYPGKKQVLWYAGYNGIMSWEDAPTNQGAAPCHAGGSVAACIVIPGSTNNAAQGGSVIAVSSGSSMAQSTPQTYVIGPQDVLDVRVWNEPQLTNTVTVRADGKISLMFVGDLQAASRTTDQLARDIEAQLRKLIKDPHVSVAVQTAQSTPPGSSRPQTEQHTAITQGAPQESDREREVRILTGNYQAQVASRSVAVEKIRAKYGPPDQIEDRNSDPQHPSQIFRYNYLAAFASNVEFEFPIVKGVAQGPRINVPLPIATFEGAPSVDTRFLDVLSRENPLPVALSVTAGLPGRHASMQIYAAREYRVLNVPLDGLTGTVDLVADIKSAGQPIVRDANLRDTIDASAGTAQANFMLAPGTYDCQLLVRERATGRMFGETIHFEVK